jgi:hypothetical protein
MSDLFELNARLSVTGCLINMLGFLLESLSFLSLSIRAQGPNDWARFEAQVFLYYFILVAGALLACNIVDETTDAFTHLKALYNETQVFANYMVSAYGADFPLKMDPGAGWLRDRQEAVGGEFWYNLSITVPTLSVMCGIQLIGILTAWLAREEVWVPTLRVVLCFDMAIILSFYAAMAFLSMAAINLVHNLIAISTVPLCVQFIFALLYAVQSDILPIFASMPPNSVLAGCKRLAFALPPVALVMTVLGIALYLFFEPSTATMDPSTRDALAFGLIGCGSAVLGTVTVVGLYRALVYCNNYAQDWSQMVYDMLVARFGAAYDDEEEEDGNEAEKGMAKGAGSADQPTPEQESTTSTAAADSDESI